MKHNYTQTCISTINIITYKRVVHSTTKHNKTQVWWVSPIIKLSRAEVKRYQNIISGTSSHWRSMQWLHLTCKGWLHISVLCLQCFDAVGWAAGRASSLQKAEWWDVGMVICLGWGADLHMAQQMPLPLTISCSSESRLVLTFLVLPFWYLLTRVVPDKFQKSSKTVVCVCSNYKLLHGKITRKQYYRMHNKADFAMVSNSLVAWSIQWNMHHCTQH